MRERCGTRVGGPPGRGLLLASKGLSGQKAKRMRRKTGFDKLVDLLRSMPDLIAQDRGGGKGILTMTMLFLFIKHHAHFFPPVSSAPTLHCRSLCNPVLPYCPLTCSTLPYPTHPTCPSRPYATGGCFLWEVGLPFVLALCNLDRPGYLLRPPCAHRTAPHRRSASPLGFVKLASWSGVIFKHLISDIFP